jgi:predicted nucleotidyltransferase
MFPHHTAAIERVTAAFQDDPDVAAVLLGGSIAHGFAQESSDIDIMIVVSDDDHRQRQASGAIHYYRDDLCDYPGGYVDGKYIGPAFLDEAERHGSEPARFAFADAQVLFSRVDGLAEQVARIARYPVALKADRIGRFHAQLQGWMWYAGEAAKRNDAYLMGVATTRALLFGGRMILAHNELLYPFHKWFFAVLERAPDKPEGLLEAMRRLSREPSLERAAAFCDLILGFREWETDGLPWPNRFMADSELTWMRDAAAIDDI